MTKNKPLIIGISGAAGHGKDLIREIILSELKFWGIPAAGGGNGDLVKFCCYVYAEWDGEKDEAGRTKLQRVGGGAREKNPDIWVSMLETIVANLLDVEVFVVSDIRYPNELSYWRRQGYPVLSLKVFRPEFDNGLTAEQKAHSSETAMNDETFDKVFINDGSKSQLEIEVIDFLEAEVYAKKWIK